VLFCDLSCQTLSSGVLTDFDAMAAFDHVIAGLSMATCKRVGLPLIVGHFMFNLLKDMHFHLVTGFGKPSSGFTNTQDNKTGQGVIQGSSSAAPIFILNSDVSISAYTQLWMGASFIHPISGDRVEDHVAQFVDDTSQFLNKLCAWSVVPSSDNTPDNSLLSGFASKNAHLWSNLLWVSRGKLNLNKCFYYGFTPYINYKNKQNFVLKNVR